MDLERLRASDRPRVLLVSHGGEGGIARHLDDLRALLASRIEVLALAPDADGTLALTHEGGGLWFAIDEWDSMLAVLRAVGVDRVHFHHVHGLPARALELGTDLGAAWDVTLHDYFPACPAYHLAGADARFCGGTPACLRCDESRPPQWGLDIPAWRAKLGDFLGKAARVMVPSVDVAERLRGFFPRVRTTVMPHAEEGTDPRAPAIARVLVPGAISPEKGLAKLEACVRDAAARRLGLHFHVVGFIARPIPLWPELPLTITGEYPEGSLPALLARERGDCIFFPAQVPETFSYTLSDALDSGLPIVASRLGALAERLAPRPDARLVAWDAPPAEFNAALLAASRPPTTIAPARERVSPRDYGDRYLAPFPARTRSAGGRLPAVEERWRRRPAYVPADTTLQWLVEDAFDCGRMKTLRRLKRMASGR